MCDHFCSPGGRPVFRSADVPGGQTVVQQRVQLRPSRDHAGASGRVPGSGGQRSQGQQHAHMEGGRS